MRFLHGDTGFNFRMTNIQAAIGLAQLENFDRLVQLRIRMAEMYLESLSRSKGVYFRQCPGHCLNVYWMFALLIDEGVYGSRDHLMNRLAAGGVDTRRFFHAADELPFLLKKGLVPTDKRFPISTKLSQQGLYFPSSPTLTSSDIRYICDTLLEMERR